MAEARKIDPFDVEALEKSLNDSATRVSTIWVSFLIFSLYLLTAATTVTHRQLFLAEPIKLPVLNIDLPLWGFFWLAPILFVIFHAYVLIQLILLARTAAAYDVAVTKLAKQDNLSAEANASLRQRLANTLFAQILAGSPREREGWFGSLLKAMAWITLVIGPILILFTFQSMFLPYHSHLATWTHRLLILLELVVAFRLWPLVLNPQRDFQVPTWQWWIRDTATDLYTLFKSSEGQQRAWQGFLDSAFRVEVIVIVASLYFSLSTATFPGEPHVNLFTGESISAVRCYGGASWANLSLEGIDVVDHDKLEKIQQATSKAGENAYEGERTRILRGRDFNCGDFSSYADLRRIDFSRADLREANFTGSKLEGVSFSKSQLQGASFIAAQLQGASLDGAHLQGGDFRVAGLQGASLQDTNLQGADLRLAQLQGAILDRAQLQGASLNDAELQGTTLDGAKFQGASLNGAQLQGSILDHAQLQGASLNGTQLQGASFVDTGLDNAILSGAWIWRASLETCGGARITHPRNDAVILVGFPRKKDPVPIDDQLADFIEESAAKIAGVKSQERVRRILRKRLTTDASKDNDVLAKVWLDCESRNVAPQEFDDRHVIALRAAVCDASSDGASIGKGVARNWISKDQDRREFSIKLARALLGEDGTPCASAKYYDDRTKALLRDASGVLPAAIAPK
jgi:uncharacterized protein YjbI with pentapeptide repeats